jgi:leucyl-tRNA synthetase
MILGEDGQKMSKSMGNVVNPDDDRRAVRRRRHAHVRDVHGPARDGSIAHATWPGFDPALCEDDEVEVVIQVNGKVRGRFMVAKDATREALEAQAMADERLVRWVEGKTVRKVIVVPGKLVNVVVS